MELKTKKAMPFQLSDQAIAKLSMLSNSNNKKYFRVYVTGGGCSGFQYEYSLAESIQNGDIEFMHRGAKIYIDEVSINYLKGSVLDYSDTLLESSFKIVNPNASSSCGCGVSFTV